MTSIAKEERIEKYCYKKIKRGDSILYIKVRKPLKVLAWRKEMTLMVPDRALRAR